MDESFGRGSRGKDGVQVTDAAAFDDAEFSSVGEFLDKLFEGIVAMGIDVRTNFEPFSSLDTESPFVFRLQGRERLGIAHSVGMTLPLGDYSITIYTSLYGQGDDGKEKVYVSLLTATASFFIHSDFKDVSMNTLLDASEDELYSPPTVGVYNHILKLYGWLAGHFEELRAVGKIDSEFVRHSLLPAMLSDAPLWVSRLAESFGRGARSKKGTDVTDNARFDTGPWEYNTFLGFLRDWTEGKDIEVKDGFIALCVDEYVQSGPTGSRKLAGFYTNGEKPIKSEATFYRIMDIPSPYSDRESDLVLTVKLTVQSIMDFWGIERVFPEECASGKLPFRIKLDFDTVTFKVEDGKRRSGHYCSGYSFTFKVVPDGKTGVRVLFNKSQPIDKEKLWKPDMVGLESVRKLVEGLILDDEAVMNIWLLGRYYDNRLTYGIFKTDPRFFKEIAYNVSKNRIEYLENNVAVPDEERLMTDNDKMFRALVSEYLYNVFTGKSKHVLGKAVYRPDNDIRDRIVLESFGRGARSNTKEKAERITQEPEDRVFAYLDTDSFVRELGNMLRDSGMKEISHQERCHTFAPAYTENNTEVFAKYAKKDAVYFTLRPAPKSPRAKDDGTVRYDRISIWKPFYIEGVPSQVCLSVGTLGPHGGNDGKKNVCLEIAGRTYGAGLTSMFLTVGDGVIRKTYPYPFDDDIYIKRTKLDLKTVFRMALSIGYWGTMLQCLWFHVGAFEKIARAAALDYRTGSGGSKLADEIRRKFGLGEGVRLSDFTSFNDGSEGSVYAKRTIADAMSGVKV